jgi:hypothetical protein
VKHIIATVSAIHNRVRDAHILLPVVIRVLNSAESAKCDRRNPYHRNDAEEFVGDVLPHDILMITKVFRNAIGIKIVCEKIFA